MAAHRNMFALQLLSAALIAGCGASPPARFYGLSAIETDVSVHPVHAVATVGPVAFPDYLDRPQIVTRGPGDRLQLAEFDRWAEPLGNAFARTLADNLDRLLDEVLVVQQSYAGSSQQETFRVTAQVMRFDVSSNSEATLDVLWGIDRPDGTSLVATTRSRHSSMAADAGFESRVSALNDTLDALSREIADVFRAARDR